MEIIVPTMAATVAGTPPAMAIFWSVVNPPPPPPPPPPEPPTSDTSNVDVGPTMVTASSRRRSHVWMGFDVRDGSSTKCLQAHVNDCSPVGVEVSSLCIALPLSVLLVGAFALGASWSWY